MSGLLNCRPNTCHQVGPGWRGRLLRPWILRSLAASAWVKPFSVVESLAKRVGISFTCHSLLVSLVVSIVLSARGNFQMWLRMHQVFMDFLRHWLLYFKSSKHKNLPIFKDLKSSGYIPTKE